MKKIAGILLTDTHLKESNIDINIKVFEQAIKFCLENKLNKIWHLGDIFNSRKAQPLDVLDAFEQILDLLHKAGIEMITIPGNHDKTSYDSDKSFLNPFRHHPALKLVTTQETFFITDDIAVDMIPYFSDHIYKEWLEVSEKKRVAANKRILFTHIGVNGAVMNNGVAVDGILKDLFAIYEKVYIGHYHDKQIFDKINYIGGSIQHNFGEDPEKGLTILYDDLTFETKTLIYPKYHKIETDVSTLSLKDIESIRKEVEESGDMIRIVLVGSEAEIKGFNKQSLLAAGVAVATKAEEINREEIDERVEPFTQGTLIEEFEKFTVKNNLDLETGKKYLMKALQ